MKTYEDVKAIAEKEIARLEQCIKDVKKNYTYDFKCPQCKETKQVSVFLIKVQYKIYCSVNCRANAWRDKKELGIYSRQELNKRKQKRDKIKKEIIKQKQKRDEIKKEIIKLRNEGLTFAKIGTKFNISRQRVQKIYSKMTKNDS